MEQDDQLRKLGYELQNLAGSSVGGYPGAY
jgi:hypothetical protein